MQRQKEKKDYKVLYETEVNNRKLIELRYKELRDENIELQKETGLAELRVKYNKALAEISFLREDRSRLYLQLEDARNELSFLKRKKKSCVVLFKTGICPLTILCAFVTIRLCCA